MDRDRQSKMVIKNYDDLRILNFLKSYKEDFENKGNKYIFFNTSEYKEIIIFFNSMIDKIEEKFIEEGKKYNL